MSGWKTQPYKADDDNQEFTFKGLAEHSFKRRLRMSDGKEVPFQMRFVSADDAQILTDKPYGLLFLYTRDNFAMDDYYDTDHNVEYKGGDLVERPLFENAKPFKNQLFRVV